MSQDIFQKIRLCLALADNNTSDSEIIKCIKQNLPEFGASRLTEPDKKIEFDGNMKRKTLYRDIIIVYSIVLAILAISYIAPFILPFINGKPLLMNLEYATGGATVGNTSLFTKQFSCKDSSVGEKVKTVIGLIIIIALLGSLIQEGVSMFSRENDYYNEITTGYTQDSEFNYKQCVKLGDNKLMAKLVASVIVAILFSVIFLFVFVDQLEDFPSYFYVWFVVLMVMILSGISLGYKYFEIFNYSSGEYEYKCDKFFPST